MLVFKLDYRLQNNDKTIGICKYDRITFKYSCIKKPLFIKKKKLEKLFRVGFEHYLSTYAGLPTRLSGQ